WDTRRHRDLSILLLTLGEF
ncbi:hypothetical protein V3C99_008606, partial [Haemonchus contortus]